MTCMSVHKLWIQERLPLASSKDYGANLQSVQHYLKKNQVSPKDDICLRSAERWPDCLSWNFFWFVLQTLQRELTGRRARIEEVLDRAGIIASLRTPEVDFVREGAGHVHQLWEVLQLETERRSVMLEAALQAQQYYSEAAKVESWLSGQKLHVASEEKGTVCTILISYPILCYSHLFHYILCGICLYCRFTKKSCHGTAQTSNKYKS